MFTSTTNSTQLDQNLIFVFFSWSPPITGHRLSFLCSCSAAFPPNLALFCLFLCLQSGGKLAITLLYLHWIFSLLNLAIVLSDSDFLLSEIIAKVCSVTKSVFPQSIITRNSLCHVTEVFHFNSHASKYLAFIWQ